MYSLPHSSIMNSLEHGPKMNTQNNIISGPHSGQYWNHSPGLEQPLIREEGPFPIQGNIGSLLKQEAYNYSKCDSSLPNISGSPNCTAASAFVPDIYTSYNSCGENCTLKYPEAYGDQNFGLLRNKEGNYDLTNSHALHAYENVRAGVEGKGPSNVYGCYEWVPNLGKTNGDSCTLDQYPAYQQVGDWTKLSQNQDLISYNFKM